MRARVAVAVIRGNQPPMTDFVTGAWVGCCITLVSLMVFVLVFGERDD